MNHGTFGQVRVRKKAELSAAIMLDIRCSFNPQPKAQAFLRRMQCTMHACAFGCGLNKEMIHSQVNSVGV